ncbi:hypothetical protein HK102_004922, partial [Quaeritorhiza haematococci]
MLSLLISFLLYDDRFMYLQLLHEIVSQIVLDPSGMYPDFAADEYGINAEGGGALAESQEGLEGGVPRNETGKGRLADIIRNFFKEEKETQDVVARLAEEVETLRARCIELEEGLLDSTSPTQVTSRGLMTNEPPKRRTDANSTLNTGDVESSDDMGMILRVQQSLDEFNQRSTDFLQRHEEELKLMIEAVGGNSVVQGPDISRDD